MPEVDLLQKRFTPALPRLIAFQTARVRSLFLSAAGLPWRVGGRLGIELRITMVAGLAMLRRIGQEGDNPFARRPDLTAKDRFWIIFRALYFPVV